MKKHVKNSDGSCVIYTYAGKKCTECGKEIYGELLSELRTTKCNHWWYGILAYIINTKKKGEN